MNKNIKSVVAIIFHPENKKLVLGVSRKDDHTKMGLPGGKIDAGETPLEALEAFRARNKKYKNEKMTYAGRLDPMAEGVLIVLVGEEVHNKEKYLIKL